jgi:hypothetical protein
MTVIAGRITRGTNGLHARSGMPVRVPQVKPPSSPTWTRPSRRNDSSLPVACPAPPQPWPLSVFWGGHAPPSLTIFDAAERSPPVLNLIN